jgi:hypothetical protein
MHKNRYFALTCLVLHVNTSHTKNLTALVADHKSRSFPLYNLLFFIIRNWVYVDLVGVESRNSKP